MSRSRPVILLHLLANAGFTSEEYKKSQRAITKIPSLIDELQRIMLDVPDGVEQNEAYFSANILSGAITVPSFSSVIEDQEISSHNSKLAKLLTIMANVDYQEVAKELNVAAEHPITNDQAATLVRLLIEYQRYLLYLSDRQDRLIQRQESYDTKKPVRYKNRARLISSFIYFPGLVMGANISILGDNLFNGKSDTFGFSRSFCNYLEQAGWDYADFRPRELTVNPGTTDGFECSRTPLSDVALKLIEETKDVVPRLLALARYTEQSELQAAAAMRAKSADAVSTDIAASAAGMDIAAGKIVDRIHGLPSGDARLTSDELLALEGLLRFYRGHLLFGNISGEFNDHIDEICRLLRAIRTGSLVLPEDLSCLEAVLLETSLLGGKKNLCATLAACLTSLDIRIADKFASWQDVARFAKSNGFGMYFCAGQEPCASRHIGEMEFAYIDDNLIIPKHLGVLRMQADYLVRVLEGFLEYLREALGERYRAQYNQFKLAYRALSNPDQFSLAAMQRVQDSIFIDGRGRKVLLDGENLKRTLFTQYSTQNRLGVTSESLLRRDSNQLVRLATILCPVTIILERLRHELTTLQKMIAHGEYVWLEQLTIIDADDISLARFKEFIQDAFEFEGTVVISEAATVNPLLYFINQCLRSLDSARSKAALQFIIKDVATAMGQIDKLYIQASSDSYSCIAAALQPKIATKPAGAGSAAACAVATGGTFAAKAAAEPAAGLRVCADAPLVAIV